MDTVSSSNRLSDVQPMMVRRFVAGPPWRTIDATWDAVSGIISRLLDARGYDAVSEITRELESLRPLMRHVLLMRWLQDGVVEFDTGDLRLMVTVTHGLHHDDDLSLPPVAVFDPLPHDAPIALRLRTVAPVDDPYLAKIIAGAGTQGLLVEIIPPSIPPLAEDPNTEDSIEEDNDGDK